MRFHTALAIVTIAFLPTLASAAEENSVRQVMVVTASEPTVDVGELVAKVARKTGRQFALDSHVAGRVSVVGFDVEKVDYDTLLAVLRLNGYATLTSNGLVSVFPDAVVRQLPMPTITADDPKIGDDELVTRVIQLRSACAAHMVPILRPMMPQYAHLAAHADINMLIMVDRAANVRRIADLVEKLEKQAAAQKQNCLREVKSPS